MSLLGSLLRYESICSNRPACPGWYASSPPLALGSGPDARRLRQYEQAKRAATVLGGPELDNPSQDPRADANNDDINSPPASPDAGYAPKPDSPDSAADSVIPAKPEAAVAGPADRPPDPAPDANPAAEPVAEPNGPEPSPRPEPLPEPVPEPSWQPDMGAAPRADSGRNSPETTPEPPIDGAASAGACASPKPLREAPLPSAPRRRSASSLAIACNSAGVVRRSTRPSDHHGQRRGGQVRRHPSSPTSAGYYYFQIGPGGHTWDQIWYSGTAAASCPSPDGGFVP